MSDSYTWINFSRNISTTQNIKEVSNESYGYFFVAIDSEKGWIKADKENRAVGVAGQLWRDNFSIRSDICTLGDGVFVQIEEGSEVKVNKKAYCTPNGLLTTDATFKDAVELNAWVTEENVSLVMPDGTSIKGARIGFNSAL